MQLTSTPAAAAATTQMGDGPASLKEELKKERGFVESVLRITMGGRRNLLNRHGREKSNWMGAGEIVDERDRPHKASFLLCNLLTL